MTFDEEMMDEIRDALNFVVNSGYYSEQEIIDYSKEYLSEIFEEYELDEPTIEEIESIIFRLKRKTKDLTNYKRLQNVFNQLNTEKIIAIDYAGFDMSEGHEEVATVLQYMQDNNIERKGYCFFHQQDIERRLEGNSSLLIAFGSTAGDEEKAIAVGRHLVELLKNENFVVNWDGTTIERIAIEEFNWNKQYNGELYSTDLSLEIMKQKSLED